MDSSAAASASNRPAPTPFGSHARAQDGLIVTFELANGDIKVERFAQLIHTKGGYKRVEHFTGDRAIKQAADRADELDAKILSISSPQTILTDLQGSRQHLDVKPTGLDGQAGGRQRTVASGCPCPELLMLGMIGRTELFKLPTNGQNDQNIRQVTQRHSSR